MFHFSIFDIGVVALLTLSLLMGLKRGLTREIFIFVAWAGAAFVTVWTLPYATRGVSVLIPWPATASVFAMVGVFCLTLWLLLFVSKLISDKIKSSFFGSLDRILGAVFGLARGAFVVSLLYLALAFFMPNTQAWSWVSQAYLRAPVMMGAEWIAGLAPNLFITAQKAIVEIGAIKTPDMITELKNLLPESPDEKTKDAYSDTAREELDELIEDTTEEHAGS